MPMFGGRVRRGNISAYQPKLHERIGGALGRLGSQFGMSQREQARLGRRFGAFLNDWTPVGMLDGALYGSKSERQLAMLPLPGPTRRGGKLALDEASRLARARAQGYRDVPYYRGEQRSGPMPSNYEGRGSVPFSQDKSYADGFGLWAGTRVRASSD